MILVRDVFQVKFGKAKDAVAAWKEGIALMKNTYGAAAPRLLTDYIGPSYYTLVFESTWETLADFEKQSTAAMSNAEWKTWYARVGPLMDGGHREILKIEA